MALQSSLYAKENRRLSPRKAGENVDPLFLSLLLILLAVGLVLCSILHI